ncbi:pRiA4b ORF-3-like protein [Corynebacterium mucifaciens]
MTVSVLMIVEGASPEISRCVNVDETMTLGELAQIIDASLGFTGAATHLYVGREGAQRCVYAEVPGAGEHHEDELTVAEMPPLTYVYDPAANWNVHVEVLGPSSIEGPTPMLVDAAGPDVVEACSGPELMTTFRNQARLLAAGIDPDLDTITLMFSYLPVMPPERMLDRMTQADPVAVSTRIGNVAEEMFFDEVAAADAQDDGPGLAQHFDDFLQSRPDLLQIIDMDPHPERNPAMINAVTEFFGEVLEGPRDLAGVVAELMGIFSAGVPYDNGEVPPAVAGALRDVVQLPFPLTVADFLLDAGLLSLRGGQLAPTETGLTFLNHPDPIPAAADHLRRGFEGLMGESTWRWIVESLVSGEPTDAEPGDWLPWLEAFGIARETAPGQVVCTDQGLTLLQLHHAHYTGGN